MSSGADDLFGVAAIIAALNPVVTLVLHRVNKRRLEDLDVKVQATRDAAEAMVGDLVGHYSRVQTTYRENAAANKALAATNEALLTWLQEHQ